MDSSFNIHGVRKCSKKEKKEIWRWNGETCGGRWALLIVLTILVFVVTGRGRKTNPNRGSLCFKL